MHYLVSLALLQSSSGRVSYAAIKGGRFALLDHLYTAESADLGEFVKAVPQHVFLEEVSNLSFQHRLDDSSYTLCPPRLSDSQAIWGVGLNYRAHASDLDESPPLDMPVLFLKRPCVLSSSGEVQLPKMSSKVTAEGELVAIIGNERSRSSDDPLDNVWGFAAALDMTAEDILRKNPRYLTIAKNFPTFLCLSERIVPRDELLRVVGLPEITVQTISNGRVAHSARVSAMTHSLGQILYTLYQVQEPQSGDIILTGTPGAVEIRAGDRVSANVGDILRVSAVAASAT